ncbi:N-formylglutamate deformylase [Paraburkholderia caribensis MBA4]|uniref:N-formylglutamate deformylase n=1 Tax=Paraburkholderia caribensis MBA4 TaxID=1323664 RepID=A0A0P0RKN4_9BURK|nr:N-formylglutamate deformylase [Paraburkholderia caribensis]ALL69331.1 N-formylglutamate deformylase [Paraburkholderia caribensis MBA4]
MTHLPVFDFKAGTSPVLISIPHLGRIIPDDLRAEYTDVARTVADTDWHLDQLYDFAAQAGAAVLSARVSRYVIDLNRPPSGESLYPGQTTTGLCPTETFRGEPLYVDGKTPSAETIAKRLDAFHAPYHAKLRETLDALKAEFGQVLLWEAHSIASLLPRLFDGKLPDLNLGTNAGQSCAPQVLDAITTTLDSQPFTWVANGRFKGGYITREFGRPEQGVHAIQLEMCQSTYMDESAPFAYRPELAARVKPVVESMMAAALDAVQRLRR